MKNKFLICVICVICGGIFPSCSPQKRLERLLKRYPELILYDTITHSFTIHDTLYTSPIALDTVVLSKKIDTIIITQNNLTTQVIRHFDSIYILTNYSGDTIFYEKTIEKQIPVEKIKYIKEDYWNQFIKTIPYLCLAFIALVISAIFLYKKK